MTDLRSWKGYCRCGKRIIFHCNGYSGYWTHKDGTIPCINFSKIPMNTPITRAITKAAK